MINLNYLFKAICLFFVGSFFFNQSVSAQISDTLSAKTLKQEAAKLRKAGNFNEAIIGFKKVAVYYKKENLWKQFFGIHIDLSACYAELGQYDEAKRSVDTLINESKLKLETPQRFIINGYNTLGNINFKLSNLDEAAAAYTSAIELSLETYGEDHLTTADSYASMASLFEQIGDDQKSLEYNLKALEIREKLLDKNHVDLAFSYGNIGLIYKNRSDLKKALDYYLKAESIFEATIGNMHPKMGIIKNNIGRVYAEQNKVDLAIQYYKEVVEIFTTALGPDHPNIGLIQTNIALIHLDQSQFDESEKHLNKAYDVWSKSLPEDHYYLGVYHNNIALIQGSRLQFEEALISINTGIEIYKKRIGNSPELTMLYNNLAEFLKNLNKYDQAIDACNKALMLNVIQSNNGVISFKDPCYNPSEYLRTYAIKAKVYNDQFDKSQDIAFAKKAFKVLDESEKIINERNKIYISEDDHVLKSSYLHACLKLGTNLHSKLYSSFNDPVHIEEAFRFAERSKAKILLQSTNVVDPDLYAKVPANIIEEERQTRTNITDYESEILRLALAGDSIKIVEYRDQKLFNEKLKLDTLINRMRTDYPDYYDMKYATDLATINAIQEKIPEETLLISYALDYKQYEQFTRSRTPKLHLFSISKNTSTINILDWSEKDDSLAYEFHKLIQKSSIVKTKNKRRFIELGNYLYQKLLGSIKNEMNGKKRLVIIGESDINYIPFEALVQNNKDQSFQNLDYLIKDFEVSYHYSATLYLKSLQKKQDINDLNLLAFAPVFDDPTKNTITANQQRYFQDTTYSFLRDNRYQPLIWSEKEVLAIHELFQSKTKKRNKLLLRNDASEGALKLHIKQHNGIIHIASHSFANLSSPKFSGIACAVNAEDTNEDGILHVNEIYNIQLNADLVVLSSCESGFGYISRGEGMLGINRSFLYSGTNNVLYSLWKVNDKASSELMVEFYKQIFKNKDYATSLRASKLKLMTNEATALPNYWAPFVLIGR